MKNKTVSIIVLMLLLTSPLILMNHVQRAKAQTLGTVYVRTDGSVDPPTTPISTNNNVSYSFTGNVGAQIVVEKDNIILDGKGYTLLGTNGSGIGVALYGKTNVTVRNIQIINYEHAVLLEDYSDFNRIIGNNITDCSIGVSFKQSSNNSVSGNNMTHCTRYIFLYLSSSNNTIIGNCIVGNWPPEVQGSSGIVVADLCCYNSISGNNITGNLNSGINLGGDCSYNIIIGNNVGTGTSAGIRVNFSCEHNTISGNNLTENEMWGVDLMSNDNIICENSIINNRHGMYIGSYVSGNIVTGNNITKNQEDGILMYTGTNNSVTGNLIANNGYGVSFDDSSNNSVTGNTITNNGYGIAFISSPDNHVYHNNFVANAHQGYSTNMTGVNFLDDGYPSGGNYWSTYNGTDANYDGIGDTPYVIDANNVDHYPLMDQYVVPEFPSSIIATMFLALGLLALAVHRRTLHLSESRV